MIEIKFYNTYFEYVFYINISAFADKISDILMTTYLLILRG